ncbi:NUDIX hydrolase [Alloiococcus sp. CFN-8]|uniref:NUDIX hydrolase n=1 Tax=Alloiococcus sp. CFN-8 TaxID=3416081 RepID=UPI003CEC1AF8
MQEEYWNIYDIDRNLTDRIHKRGVPMAEGDYHLVVHLCIFNSKGELLIQKRQPWKKGWSGLWDLTVGGSAVLGESSREAVEREAKEELGIDVNLEGHRPFMTINFEQGFDDYWMIEKDIPLESLTLQYEEVADAKWVNEEELKAMVEKGEFINYFFIDNIFKLKGHWGSVLDS